MKNEIGPVAGKVTKVPATSLKPNDKVVLVATPTGKRAKQLTSGAIVVVSTYTEKAGRTTYVIVCGFSLILDKSNAFPVKFLDDVINQWLSNNGRGWRFEIADLDGRNVRPVVEEKPKKGRSR